MAKTTSVAHNEFKVDRGARLNYTPSTKMSWATKLGAEFIGTIFLTWMIALLGVTFDGTKFEFLISFGAKGWASRLVIGFWVAADVAICLAVFSRWSCDLNPAVTSYRWLSGQNSWKYATAKLATQFIAAFVAGGVIVATQATSHAVSGNAKDAIDAYGNGYGSVWSAFTVSDRPPFIETLAGNTLALKHVLAFVGEFLGVLILLWPIFTKYIKSPALKDILVVMIVGFGVAALLEMGTVGWNPARTLATNFIFDVTHHTSAGMELYWAYLFGPIAAVFFLYGCQILMTSGKVDYYWEKWLSFGKVSDKK